MAEGAVIRFGRVTNVKDPHGAGRIQARTKYDNKIANDEELPYYIPFLPKMLHIKPKVGELALLISMAVGEHDHCNFYVAPLISQDDKLYFEEDDKALATTETGYIDWDINPHIKSGVTETLYPDVEDIAIEGRKDTGIQLKDEEVRIKAGVKVINIAGEPKINTLHPSFVSLKYYPKNNPEVDEFMSTATIVADKINLISPAGNDPKTAHIPVTYNSDPNAEDKDNLISDSAMKQLLDCAHKLPYGDKLVEFLELLRTAFENHIHPFPTIAPCKDENMVALKAYELKDILSDNVRIN